MDDLLMLVDRRGRKKGIATTKLQAHQQGLLHGALSVFIFDLYGRLLLPQRALDVNIKHNRPPPPLCEGSI